MARSLFSVVALAAITSTLSSQIQQADQKTEDRHDAFGRRLETMIDGFIDNVKRELTDPNDSEILDTIPPPRKNRDRESEDIDQWREPGASLTFDGDKTVAEDETITSSMVVKGGDLVVFGRVQGDVLVIGGTLFVKDGGRITGNARVINGEIRQDENGIIEGYADRTSASTSGYRYDRRRFNRSGYRFSAPWTEDITNLDNLLYHFNRVEGHFFGLGSEKKYYWDGSRTLSPYGFVGWGFKSHRWRYALGLDKQWSLAGMNESAGQIIEFGLEVHSLTDSKEDWVIGASENTAAAILIHEDFHDYFGREGITAHSAYYFQQDETRLQLRVEYAADRYQSLDKQTEWSIFGGKKVFRSNPAVSEGKIRSIVVRPGLSTVDRTTRGQEGWNMYGVAEFASGSLGSDYAFSTLMADIRRYQPLSRYDNFNIRIRIGTSGGKTPQQRIFDLGGLGTLHARPYKSESGNRMILLNTEYIVNGDVLDDLDFWPSWLFSKINFVLMADAGFTRTVAPEYGWTEGFDAIKLSDFKNDLGVGIGNRSGSVRIGFAWRTDVKAPARFFFRFTRPF